MASRNVIFDCAELNAACAAALAAGKTLDAVFALDANARNGPNGTKYMSLVATVGAKTGQLLVRIADEIHIGGIAPLDEAGCAKVNAARKSSAYPPVAPRGVKKAPAISINKYKVKVEAAEPGAPAPPLPGDDQVSDFFRLCAHIDNFFYSTVDARLKSGALCKSSTRGDTVALPGAVVVSNTEIVKLYQDRVSLKSTTSKTPGAPLANPICRAVMKFDEVTGLPANGLRFFDKTKVYYTEQGQRVCEALKFDGEPVTAANVHGIVAGSRIDGIINMNAACISNFGISIPIRFEAVIVTPPPARAIELDAIFTDAMFADAPAPPAPSQVAAASTAAPLPSYQQAAAAMPDEDLDAVLGDLSVDAL